MKRTAKHAPVAVSADSPKRHILLKTLLAVFTPLIIILGGFMAGVALVNYGPSPAVRDLLVTTVMQTSAAKPLATLFFSAEEIAEIQENNSVKIISEVTDPNLIEKPDDGKTDLEAITVEHISGGTYRATVMLVQDPLRVSVATIPDYSAAEGMTVMDMIHENGGVAGVNGGAFEDIGGLGHGNRPIGFVISDGVWRSGDDSYEDDIIGFDENDRLVVGHMSGRQAREMKLRDALTFGPTLIVNGVPAEITGNAGGLNPRTAIGQRADGAVILLVIDGRQPNSLGGNYRDIIEIMQRYGAVNAANLDGGNSAHMVYNGEIITTCSALSGPRTMPTAVIVR